MAVVFPSKDWLDELQKRVNSDETYKRVAARWEGDLIYEIEIDQEALKDLQKPKVLRGLISVLAAIPKEKRLAYTGTPMEKLVQKLGLALDQDIDLSKLNFEELAKKVGEIKFDEVKGASIYIWLDFWHGELRNAKPVAPGEIPNPKFIISGPYAIFKDYIRGKFDATIIRKLKFKGDLGYLMRNMATISRYGQILASIPIDVG
ncbi:MAG: SCP2 sterol-binding domain-containing protein [Candidatus Nezhaarchaeales archaeon]